MNSMKYLNTVLTVIAVLLAAHLVTPGSTPVATTPVEAQSGIPNAGAQRVQMIEALQSIDGSISEVSGKLNDTLTVSVDNFPAEQD